MQAARGTASCSLTRSKISRELYVSNKDAENTVIPVDVVGCSSWLRRLGCQFHTPECRLRSRELIIKDAKVPRNDLERNEREEMELERSRITEKEAKRNMIEDAAGVGGPRMAGDVEAELGDEVWVCKVERVVAA